MPLCRAHNQAECVLQARCFLEWPHSQSVQVHCLWCKQRLLKCFFVYSI
ncbi:hypothetical protein BMETH_1823_0 [methanotrophic bacterial endosymbiont of Bathymodiolus sp.]|nr:hypothetical protein BMETH_1823_0 [methanotrophic bacterial endosymbiont of Bathymodiolus sp.]